MDALHDTGFARGWSPPPLPDCCGSSLEGLARLGARVVKLAGLTCRQAEKNACSRAEGWKVLPQLET